MPLFGAKAYCKSDSNSKKLLDNYNFQKRLQFLHNSIKHKEMQIQHWQRIKNITKDVVEVNVISCKLAKMDAEVRDLRIQILNLD
ncbi:hypothetical protein [Adoxophyes orana nucleopolyhedrovirus]|uniref:hypothetical protein n=1 Tax=Adoxophyes orana nucleopolyhedrovirus TaxID=542343 RepID=UPI0001829BEE|nr:hypothetical protein [Adoxophyes orana nucleopolyhedrovirus]ACF05321.1 hypothetical protein [Adoxophyes orana nucleopolyhedrovirus]